MAESTAGRLVLYLDETGPHAAIYPSDATPYSAPLATFPLTADQKLPRIEPGATVSVDGPLTSGTRPTVRAGDVEIHPAKGLSVPSSHGRLFAERGDVIGHPGAIGWVPSWRHVSSASTDDVDGWTRRLARARRAGIAGVIMLVVMVVFLVLGSLDGDPPVLIGTWLAVGGFGASIAGWRHARRAKRALDAAQVLDLDGQPRPMLMDLWWAAGTLHGPQAVATLVEPSSGEVVAEVPVVNVPSGYEPQDRCPVEVFGDPTHAPVIRDGTTTLWPAEEAMVGTPLDDVAEIDRSNASARAEA